MIYRKLYIFHVTHEYIESEPPFQTQHLFVSISFFISYSLFCWIDSRVLSIWTCHFSEKYTWKWFSNFKMFFFSSISTEISQLIILCQSQRFDVLIYLLFFSSIYIAAHLLFQINKKTKIQFLHVIILFECCCFYVYMYLYLTFAVQLGWPMPFSYIERIQK